MAGVLAALVRAGEDRSSTSKTPKAASAPSAGSSGSSTSTWDPRVIDIVNFVEQRRGLRFKHPVPMEFLADAAFDKKVTSSGSPSVSQQNEANNTLALLR